jgi:hypothetical protein
MTGSEGLLGLGEAPASPSVVALLGMDRGGIGVVPIFMRFAPTDGTVEQV